MSLLAKNDVPIGIFDSGIGGLTILHALQKMLPCENFIYLGDTARLPYGTKSPQTVQNYALNVTDILVHEGIKALVVACNTATAASLEALQQKFSSLPVIGVIQPGAKASLTIPGDGPIVVLATEGTVKWHAYKQTISQLASERHVIEWPCSLLVTLAEEGWCEGALVEQIISRILSALFSSLENVNPACIVLGCTHFPVFKAAMRNVIGAHIPIVDPAHTVAQEVFSVLLEQGLLSQSKERGFTRFMATDGPERFARVAEIFLNRALLPHEIELVTVPTFSSDLNSGVVLKKSSNKKAANSGQ